MVAPVLQIGLPGTTEMAIILLVLVLLFGANKIPKLARSTGQAMGEFQKGREQVEDELQNIKEGESSADASSGTSSDASSSDSVQEGEFETLDDDDTTTSSSK